MLRIVFFAVTLFWVVGLVVALLNISRISAEPFYIIFSGFTFCVAVLAVLEQLRKKVEN